jgi:hypothetical protein
MALKHGDVESGVMEQLGYRFVGQYRPKIRGIINAAPTRGAGPGRKIHQVADAFPGRHLNQAQAVAMEVEPRGFGIDGDAIAEVDAVREIAIVEFDGDSIILHSDPLPPCSNM